MSFFDTVTEKWGLLKAIAVALVFGVAVWSIGHWSAASGHPVSVLWGLVQYTKSQNVEVEGPATGTASTSEVSPSGEAEASPEPSASRPDPSTPPRVDFAWRVQEHLRQVHPLHRTAAAEAEASFM